MLSPKQRCPECNALSLKNERTVLISIEKHELESARKSFWRCSSCGARFKLITPPGKMYLKQKGSVTLDMCRAVLEHLGIAEKFPEFFRKSDR